MGAIVPSAANTAAASARSTLACCRHATAKPALPRPSAAAAATSSLLASLTAWGSPPRMPHTSGRPLRPLALFPPRGLPPHWPSPCVAAAGFASWSFCACRANTAMVAGALRPHPLQDRREAQFSAYPHWPHAQCGAFGPRSTEKAASPSTATRRATSVGPRSLPVARSRVSMVQSHTSAQGRRAHVHNRYGWPHEP